jgi:Phytanoyl-CoA dioxygenase (PhyH)
VPVGATARNEFRRAGWTVLRGEFEPTRLIAEVDDTLSRAFVRPHRNTSPDAAISFRYVPMMSLATPCSLELLDACAIQAAELLERPVLPVRAKATEYHGESAWHRDSDLDYPSVGFLAYLDLLTSGDGALRAVPGSHRSARPDEEQAVAIPTAPGDLIVIDEHVKHAAFGGTIRRQWRVDFIAEPHNGAEATAARAYFAGIFAPGWDGGYDVEAYPTYGDDWRRRCDPAVDTRLAELGAYALAGAEEAASRRRAVTRPGTVP